MIVHCPECDARFQVDGARIPNTGGKGRCSRCQTVFPVSPPDPDRPTVEGFRPEPSRETVEALARGPRTPSSSLPAGVDDPALTRKIDARQLAAGAEAPRPMTYRSLVADASDVAAERCPEEAPSGSSVPEDGDDLLPDLLDDEPGPAAPATDLGNEMLVGPAATPAASGAGAGVGVGLSGTDAVPGEMSAITAPPPAAGSDPRPPSPGPPPPPPEAPAEVTGRPRKRYRLLEGDGTEILLDKTDLVRRIREGRLAEDDAVAREGEDWTGAGSLPELARYFELARKSGKLATTTSAPAAPDAPPAPLACATHLDRPPGWQCGDCARGLCQECIRKRTAGMSELATCAHCGGVARVLTRPREVTPFWQDFGGLIKVCFVGWGPFMTFVYAVLYWGAMLAFSMPVPGMFKAYLMVAGALVFLFLVTFDMLVVTSATNGGTRLPDWPDFSDWGEVFVKGLKGWLVYVAVHAPILLFVFWLFGDALAIAMATGSPGAFLGIGVLFVVGTLLMTIFAFVIYPMCFALVANFESVRLALNPVAVIGSIRKAAAEYLMLLAILFALALVARSLQVGFGLIPILGGMIAAAIHAAARLTQMHALGRMIHQCDHKMGWDE